MNEAEHKALKAINRIKLIRIKAIRRFWICSCGYKTISTKSQRCRDCNAKMKPDRII